LNSLLYVQTPLPVLVAVETFAVVIEFAVVAGLAVLANSASLDYNSPSDLERFGVAAVVAETAVAVADIEMVVAVVGGGIAVVENQAPQVVVEVAAVAAVELAEHRLWEWLRERLEKYVANANDDQYVTPWTALPTSQTMPSAE
jgi:hypothetical protein